MLGEAEKSLKNSFTQRLIKDLDLGKAETGHFRAGEVEDLF